MTDDMSTPDQPLAVGCDDPDCPEHPRADPVATAEEFAADTDAVHAGVTPGYVLMMFGQEMTQERLDDLVDLGQWLVAEARWERDEFDRDAMRQHAEYEDACTLIDSQRRVLSNLTHLLDSAYAGATPGYVHDDRTAITHPGDFLAWLFGLDRDARLATATRILRQADEAGRCFYEDHAGRIAGLEGHIELLQQGRAAAARTPEQHRPGNAVTNPEELEGHTQPGEQYRPGQRMTFEEMQRAAVAAGVQPGEKITADRLNGPREHDCENGNRCMRNTEHDAKVGSRYVDLTDGVTNCPVCAAPVKRSMIDISDVSTGPGRTFTPGPWECSQDPTHGIETT